MNAWLPKNSNLTQAKIFLLRKNISFLGLLQPLVEPCKVTWAISLQELSYIMAQVALQVPCYASHMP